MKWELQIQQNDIVIKRQRDREKKRESDKITNVFISV